MHLSRTHQVREIRGRVFKIPELGRTQKSIQGIKMTDGNTPGIMLLLPLLTSFSMTDTPNQLKHLLSLLRILLKTALQETAVNKSKLKQMVKPICHMVLARLEVQTVELRFIPTPPFLSHFDTRKNGIQEK